MTKKLIAFVFIVVAVGVMIWLLPSQEEPQPQRPAAQANRMTQQAQGGDEGHVHQHAPLPEIDSLKVNVQDSTGVDLVTLTLIPGETVTMPGLGYDLRLDEFYTHFMMEDSGPVNASPHPENPAARIEILKGGEVVDYTWTFEKVPYFKMGGMGGVHGRETTGFAFAVLDVYGLSVPDHTTGNP